jgi:hypothetical protein
MYRPCKCLPSWVLLSLCLVATLTAANDRTTRPDSAEGDPLPLGVDSEIISAADLSTEPEAGFTFREQTIYVPFNKLREVFEKPGRGVFVPYEQFKKLWDAARAKLPDPAKERPPIGILIREIDSDATVEHEVVSVSAKIKLEILGKGWHEAPLRLRDAAIRSATVEGEPARVLFDAEAGYKLLVRNSDDQPRTVTVQLQYAKSFSKSPAKNSVTFQSPEAPVNRWRIRVPEAGVNVSIHPLVAASEAADGDSQPVGENETVLLAFVGATPTVRIDWTPKAEGATGLEALATVQSEQEVHIDEGVVRTRTRLQYTISRAELSELEVRVPVDQRVTGVFDPNVRQWKVRQDGDAQIISIQLFQPARGIQSLSVEVEKFLDQTAGELIVPAVQSLGVGRQHGVVVVRVGSELRAEAARRTGLSQLDSDELPPRLQRTEWGFAYRFSAVPFELALRVEPVTPRIHIDQLVEAYLGREELTIELMAIVDIQRAGIFQLKFAVPPEYEVRSVRGHAAAGATAAAVDMFHHDSDEQQVTIDFARKAEGRVGVLIELRRSIDEIALRDPNVAAAELSLDVPRAVTETESSQGRLVVYAPESLRTIPRALAGIRNISFDEAFDELGSSRGNRFAGLRPVLAYVYQARTAVLQLDVQLRKPQISVRQLLMSRVEPGVIKYTAKFFYDVRFSGVRQLRIDVPAEFSEEIRNVTPGVRDTVTQPQPDDVEAGFVAWEFRGESEFLGNRQLIVQWERPTEELEVGGSFEFQLPQLRPQGVDRAWGQVLLSKAESLDIHPSSQTSGLRPIDPQHDLMPGAEVSDASRAFEFHDDWSLAVNAKRYELEDVKRTSIERALVRMVATRSGQVSVQALYRMRSVAQGLAVQLPTGVEFDADPLRINGKVQPLKQSDDGTLFIPISDSSDEPFLLELRYTVPGDHRRLDLPVFPAQKPIQSEPAVQKVFLAVYLPEETVHLGSFGPWTPYASPKLFRPTTSLENDRHLLTWISEGIKLTDQHYLNFPTNGRLHTFTTLRPAPPPNGSLRLVAFSRRGLDAILFGTLGLFGIALVRRSPQAKLICLLAAVLVVIVADVFVPTFASQLLQERLLLGVGAVVVIWLIASLALLKTRWFASAATPEATVAQPLASETAARDADSDPASREIESSSSEETDSEGGAYDDA